MNREQRAFVLHRWPYRESSLLLDLFTEQRGRIRVMAKGGRRMRGTRVSCLQPFIPLQVAWMERMQFNLLQRADPIALALPLTGKLLYSALYVNELLYRILPLELPYNTLFNDYVHCLCQLAQSSDTGEASLRCFELALLQALGYATDFLHCADSGRAIFEDSTYRYTVGYGFVSAPAAELSTFSGVHLKALAERHFLTRDALRAAKRFTRLALRHYLGCQQLKSRELFQPFLQQK